MCDRGLYVDFYLILKWEGVKILITCNGQIDFVFVLKVYVTVNFYSFCNFSTNVAIRNLLWTYSVAYYHNDDCFALVLMNKHKAIII